MAVAEAEAAVEQAKVQYLDNIVPDSIVSGQPPTEERRRNARARSGLDGAEVRLQRAQLDRERSVITAPFAGTVDRVQVAAGERVRGSQDAAVVVDLSRLVVEAQVLEHDLPLVKVGGQARVTAAALGGRELTGRITALLPLVDSATRAGRALVEVRGDQVLRPGMYADVRLEAARLSDRVLVPARAIIERDGRPLVFVVKEGKAQWTYIFPGRSNGTDTEVLPDSVSGQVPVARGDTVIIEGHLTLTHDAPVRLVAQAERQGGEQ
jgi:HlyD family secretion protein